MIKLFNYGAIRVRTSIRRLYHLWHFLLWCVDSSWMPVILCSATTRSLTISYGAFSLSKSKTGPPTTRVEEARHGLVG
jgi:hypothetical protein